MKRLTLTAIVCVALGSFAFAGPEAILPSGKEMKTTVAPVETCDYSWTGFYVGARAGYSWSSDTDVQAEGLPNDLANPFHIDPGHQGLDLDGFVGGGQIGFNWQIGKWFVLGAEADFSGSTMDGSSTRDHFVPEIPIVGADVPLHAHQDIDWFGTVRGRIGFVPWCRLMIYGTGGFAYADVNDSVDFNLLPEGGNASYPAHRSETETGWTAGGGLEYAIARHWTVRAEYLYIDVGDQGATGSPVPANPPYHTHYNWDTQFHTVTAGVNFKF